MKSAIFVYKNVALETRPIHLTSNKIMMTFFEMSTNSLQSLLTRIVVPAALKPATYSGHSPGDSLQL